MGRCDGKAAAMTSARIFGALAYGAAAVGAGLGAEALTGDGVLDVRAVREIAPLAFTIGALSGFGVVSAWPRRLGGAMLTGAVMAVTALVFFCALYLIGDALIMAARGEGSVDAVREASKRLSARLPVGVPLTVGAFVAAGAALWLLAACARLVRRLFRARRA